MNLYGFMKKKNVKLPLCNVRAVDCFNYIWKTGQLHLIVCQFNHSVRKCYISGWQTNYTIPYSLHGVTQWWLGNTRLFASLHWKAPVAKNTRVDRTFNGTGIAQLLKVCLSKASPSSAHGSKKIALENLNQLRSQSSSWAKKSLWSLNMHSFLILPFAMFSNNARRPMVDPW